MTQMGRRHGNPIAGRNQRTGKERREAKKGESKQAVLAVQVDIPHLVLLIAWTVRRGLRPRYREPSTDGTSRAGMSRREARVQNK